MLILKQFSQEVLHDFSIFVWFVFNSLAFLPQASHSTILKLLLPVREEP